MFETDPEAQLEPLPFVQTDRLEWAYVVLTMDLPWFHVMYGFRSFDAPGEARTEIRFVPFASDLITYLEGNDPEYFLRELLLVSPGWLNGSGVNQMHPLEKLLSYDDRGTEAFAYEVMGGQRFPLGLNWDELTEIRVVFERSQLQDF